MGNTDSDQSRWKTFLSKHSYWTGAAGLLIAILSLSVTAFGLLWQISHTPSDGELKFTKHAVKDEELIYAVRNIGDKEVSLNEIHLEFSEEISIVY